MQKTREFQYFKFYNLVQFKKTSTNKFLFIYLTSNKFLFNYFTSNKFLFNKVASNKFLFNYLTSNKFLFNYIPIPYTHFNSHSSWNAELAL